MPAICAFGTGASETAGDEVKRLGCKKALIVSDSVMAKLGQVARLQEKLSAASVQFAVYDKVDAEPTDAIVAEGLRLLRHNDCDALVALGGGSPIDTAKAISILATNEGKISDFMGIGKVPKPGLPVVAIPTTAGTGSEVTGYTIITDTQKDTKMLIGSPYAMPIVALVDPDLTLSMPRGITVATGLDALTHAIESYVSLKSQPLTEVYSLEAIRLISANLRLVYANGNNLEARSNMALGSLMAGIAFSNASVALVHGMSRPIGAHFHVAHGVSNAALLGPVTGFSLMGNPRKYADIADAMGADTEGMGDDKAAGAGLWEIKNLIRDLKVPSLKDLGVEKSKLDRIVGQMAKDAIASGSPGNNPRIPTEQEIVELYYIAYG